MVDVNDKPFRSLMGTPTDVPPSKDRQYHIDSVNDAQARRVSKKLDLDDFDKPVNWDGLSVKERYALIKWIFDEHTYRRVKSEGHVQTLDAFTNSAIKQVADALNPSNREKFLGSPLRKVVDITWKLVNK
jgi:hypothetical protein